MHSAALSQVALERVVSQAERLARAGIRWWLAELHGMLPRRLAAYVDRAREPNAWLSLDLDGLSIAWMDGETLHVKEVADSLPSSIGDIAKGGLLPVRLHPKLVYQAAVDLPAAAEENLSKILEHHVGLLVPLNPSEAAFRYALTGRDLVRNTIRVDIAIVKRETLARLADRCHQIGVQARSVRLDGGTGAAAKFDFVNRSPTPIALRSRGRAWLANGAPALLFLLVLGAGKWRALQERAQIDTEIMDLTSQATQVSTLRAAISGLGHQADFINAQTQRVPRLNVLNELTNRFPDSSWLSEIHIDDDKVSVSGNAVGATSLMKAIESSKILVSPHFVAPIYGWRDGTEHFEMAIEIREAFRQP